MSRYLNYYYSVSHSNSLSSSFLITLFSRKTDLIKETLETKLYFQFYNIINCSINCSYFIIKYLSKSNEIINPLHLL